jgi:hypothetical protein
MSSLSFRSAVVALALGWTLVSPLASAELGGRTAHRRGPSAMQEVPGVFGQLWEALVSLFSKAGCSADPNGLVGSQPVTGSSIFSCENGGSLDPNGHCSSSVAPADAGCSADADGRCAPSH